MKATKDFDLCLFALQRSDLGKRARVIREEAEALARRRNVTFQLPLILYEIDLLSAAMAFGGGEEFVESYLHPERFSHNQS